MTDAARLLAYAERFFQRSGKTEFPTVARCAKSLRWTQARVASAVEDDGDDGKLMLTSYNAQPEPGLGEKFVETLVEDKS